jgi:hypothetical protein
MVQVAVPDGSAQTMTVKLFRTEVERRGPFYDLVRRYSQACNLDELGAWLEVA